MQMRLAFVFTALATPVLADSFDGLYQFDDADPIACTQVGYGNADLELYRDDILFIETACKLTNPTGLRDMPEGVLYDAVCTGEGDTWTERMLVYESFDDLAIISRGAVRAYKLCQ